MSESIDSVIVCPCLDLNPPIQTKETVGSYLVESILGIGSTAIVKLGSHLTTGEKVAIKVINPFQMKYRYRQVNIKNEVEIMKKFHHPGIIQLQDVIDQSDQTSIIMKYSEGGDLFNYIIKNFHLKEREVCKIFIQIVDALEHIHSHGIVHRDVKPENILLDHQRNIKITDFGLSTSIPTDGSRISEFCGSFLYSAPEILLRVPYIGAEVDIWALGVTLYVMTTGLVPWEGMNEREQAKNIIAAHYVLPHNLPSTTKRLLEKMLRVDPSERSTLAEIKSIVSDWKRNLDMVNPIPSC